MTVPLADQLACVEREIRMRRRVYPGRVEAGRMSEAESRREIEAMEAVLATLRAPVRAGPRSRRGAEMSGEALNRSAQDALAKAAVGTLDALAATLAPEPRGAEAVEALHKITVLVRRSVSTARGEQPDPVPDPPSPAAPVPPAPAADPPAPMTVADIPRAAAGDLAGLRREVALLYQLVTGYPAAAGPKDSDERRQHRARFRAYLIDSLALAVEAAPPTVEAFTADQLYRAAKELRKVPDQLGDGYALLAAQRGETSEDPLAVSPDDFRAAVAAVHRKRADDFPDLALIPARVLGVAVAAWQACESVGNDRRERTTEPASRSRSKTAPAGAGGASGGAPV